MPGRRELREQIFTSDGWKKRLMSVMQMCIERSIRLFCVQDIVDMEHFRRGRAKKADVFSIRGFDVLEKYLEDSSISEIMVIGASHIFVEQNGRVRRTRDHFF